MLPVAQVSHNVSNLVLESRCGVVTNPAARRANDTACPEAPITTPNAVCNKVQNITAGNNVVFAVARI